MKEIKTLIYHIDSGNIDSFLKKCKPAIIGTAEVYILPNGIVNLHLKLSHIRSKKCR